MAFPQTPLNIQVWIRIDGVLTEITEDVRTATEGAITVKRGRADEGSRSDVGEMTFMLNNRDGKYSPRNPTSEYFGKIGRNTYCQLRVVENATTYLLFTGEISAWPQRWNTPGTDVWVPITVSGILRRLGSGSSALESTLRRRIPSDTNILAYWPFEDESDTTTVASPIPGAVNAQVTGFQFAQQDELPGSKPLPVLSASARLNAQVPPPVTNPDVWQVECVYKLDAMPASLEQMLRINTSGGVHTLQVLVQTNNVRLRALDPEGGTVDETNTTAPSFNGTWNRLLITGEQDGTDAVFRITWIVIGEGSFASDITVPNVTINRVSTVTGSWGSAFEGMGFGHLAVFNELSTIFNNADHGFVGETAIDRVQRLCAEEGVDVITRGTDALSARMGPQRPNTLLALLEECADVDLGFLTERRDHPGLLYVSPQFIYSTASKLDLDYSLEQIAPPLEPMDDDQNVLNDMTVQRVDGSSTRVVDETSALSVNDPPDGVGRYDSSMTVNAYQDSQTGDIAGWAVHLGTVDEARYPVVRFKLAANPELLDAAEDIDVWNRMRILNPPEWLPPDPIDLLTQGYSYQLGSYQWDMEFNCTPYSPYDIAILDDNSVSRADTLDSEVYTAATSTATTVEVYTNAGPKWIRDESLVTNSTFEVDITGWTGSDGGAVAFATTPDGVGGHSFPGSGSLKITPDGVGVFPGAESNRFVVTPGESYRIRGWILCETTRSIDLNINWYDESDTYMSTSTVSNSLTADTWMFYDGTFTAPASSGYGRARPTVPSGTPSDIIYVDQVHLGPVTEKSPDNFPFDVKMAGEKMTVLSIKDNVFDDFARTVNPSLVDTFTRTETDTWGDADSGQTWSASGGVSTDFQVNGTYGYHVLSTINASRRSFIDSFTATDVDYYGSVAVSAVATGAPIRGGLVARYTDSNNLYFCRLNFTTSTSNLQLEIRKRVAGVESSVATYTSSITYAAGTFYRMRFRVIDTMLKAKFWDVSEAEPSDWQIKVIDGDLPTAGFIGVRSISDTGNTNVNPQVRYDDLRVYERSEGWGTTNPSGDTWTLVQGLTEERDVVNGVGTVILSSSPATFRLQTTGAASVADCEIIAQISARQVATGDSLLPGIVFRYVDTSNFYRLRVHFRTDGGINLSVTYAGTQIGDQVVSGLTYSGTETFWVQARIDGHRLRGRIWEGNLSMADEEWQIDETFTSSTIDTGMVGVSCSAFGGNTNVSPEFWYDNFRILNPQDFNVVRSQNGVVKAQAAGGDVRLFRPAIITQ